MTIDKDFKELTHLNLFKISELPANIESFLMVAWNIPGGKLFTTDEDKKKMIYNIINSAAKLFNVSRDEVEEAFMKDSNIGQREALILSMIDTNIEPETYCNDIKTALSSGEPVKLTQNLEIKDEPLSLNEPSNLDLNNREINVETGGKYGDTVVIGNGATVELKNGTINPAGNASEANSSATILISNAEPCLVTLDNVTVTGIYPVYLNSANEESRVIINSGTFYTTCESDNPDKMGPAVYVGKGGSGSTIGGKAIINDGTFGQPGVVNNFLINVEDVLRKQENKEPRNFIEVRGGIFYNFDPSNNKAEGENTNFVADGYTVVSSKVGNDTIYKVVKE